MKKTIIVTITIVMLQWFVTVGAQEAEQDTERIREEIEVVNIEVPVRVYSKKKPVKGLQKSDFKLFVNKKKQAINGFYEVRKKIETPEGKREPRLYVLIFNVLSHAGELGEGLDTLFGTVIQPGDRVMALTNNMYLKDKVIADPKDYRDKLEQILHMEWLKMKQALSSLEYNLRYLASSFKMSMKTPEQRVGGRGIVFSDPERQELIVTRFIEDYLGHLEDFKQKYFNPGQEQYLKIADYLKSQKIETWVLNFYQAPEFPMLKRNGGDVYNMIAYFAGAAEVPNPYIQEVETGLGKPNRLHVETISKVFLNTGATFHTLLMKSDTPDFYEDFQYTAVPIDSEHISRKVTRMTGGKVIASNDIEKFMKKVSGIEDVYYVLTYAPDASEGKEVVEVRVPNKKYRMVYDDQQRPRYLKQAVKALKDKTPQIRLGEVALKEGSLQVSISGVQLVREKDGEKEGEKDGEQKGKIQLNIKILNDRAQEIAGTAKGFTCRAETIPLRFRLPSLTAGQYQLIFEVNDVISGKNDVALKDLEIERDYLLEPGEEAFGFIGTPVQGEPGTPGRNTRGLGLIQPLKEIVDTSFSRDGIEPGKLPGILEKVADYCDRLRATSLNFYCLEEVNEEVLKTLQWRGKIRKEEKSCVYGYQLVKDKGKAVEKRALFEVNGREELKNNVQLNTRFKYKNVVYAPLVFNRRAQEFYRYEIIGKKEWKGKSVYVVEAVPRTAGNKGFVSGRFWVDEEDFSILRIEFYQTSVKNFDDIEKLAGEHQLAPKITIINEFEIVKKGVRFPSKLYYEEAYKDKQGRMAVQALGNVTFKDYQFFAIETRVTKEEQEKELK